MATRYRLRDLDDPSFDPGIAEIDAWGDVSDLWPIITRYRRKGAVAGGEYRTFFGAAPDPTYAHLPHYTVLGYDAVTTVLNNPAIFANEPIPSLVLEKAFGRMLLAMDAPDHTRYRKVLQQAFAPKIVQHWTETRIRPAIHGLLDDLIAKASGHGGVDLVEAFTMPYPFLAVYRLLDLPEEDVATFHKLAMTQVFVATGCFVDEAIDAGVKLGEYFRALLAERRGCDGDDLVSQFTRAEVDGERLPEAVMVAFLRHILNAAADTTYRTTGNLMIALLSDRSRFDAIRNDRALVPDAIEEGLRWEGPVVTTMRCAKQDVVLDGVAIPAGAVIHLSLGSANHDETHFPDPDRFDLSRPRQRHFGFGGGPHLCIGMHLAKLQMREAINAVLDRLPDLRFDPDYPPPAIRGFSMRAASNIHVKF